MSAFESHEDLSDFSGLVPLFPLPNAVLFPHVLLPLHVFEPRYRELTADVLAGERLLAIGLLQPGFESEYDGKTAPVQDVIGIGRVVADHQLPDGRFHIVLRGVGRARVLSEVDDDRPYRVARTEILANVESDGDTHDRRTQLIGSFRRLIATGTETAEQPRLEEVLHRALDESFPLGTLCDVLTHTANLPPELQQGLLEELDVERRGERLQELLELAIRERSNSAQREFPPAFSDN